MQQRVNQQENGQAVGPTSGTTSVAARRFLLTAENTPIAIENIGMSGEVCLAAAPRATQRLAVAKSLNRSIQEHADVWAELSKY